MLQFITKQLNDFDDKSLQRVLLFFIIGALLIISYAGVFSGFQIVDEFEHLHATWLVSIGKLPYRDFFEHHHPLLWYTFAPLISLFYDNVSVFYVMRGICFLVSLITGYYIYLIAQFWSDKNGALLSLALFLGNIVTIYNFYQFRPDVFMNCGFIIGIYYLFCYLKNSKIKNLIFSFLGFTFSFLFLQKIALLLVVVEAIILTLIFTKKLPIKSVLIAAIPAILVTCLCLFYLWIKGILPEYFALNIRFNQAMIDYFERGSFWITNPWTDFYGLVILVIVFLFKKENIFFKICAILYIAEFLMRSFYFAPHPNYYTLQTMLGAIIFSSLGNVLMPKHKFVTLLLLIFMFFNFKLLIDTVDRTSAKYNSFHHYKLADYVHKNTKPDDVLMNGYDKNFNIYRPDVSYYWFGLDMLLPVMKSEFNISQQLDVNKLVIKYRPRFVYMKDYPDLKALRTYGERKYSQKFIPELINELYQETMFENLMILK